jgi:hypothetical protein
LQLFGRFAYVEMTGFLIIKIRVHGFGYLLVHGFTLFMVVSSAFGAQRPIYRGVCTVENYGE